MNTLHEDRACLKQWEEFQVRFFFWKYFRLIIIWKITSELILIYDYIYILKIKILFI